MTTQMTLFGEAPIDRPRAAPPVLPRAIVLWPTCHSCRTPLDRCDLRDRVQLCDRCSERHQARTRPELRP